MKSEMGPSVALMERETVMRYTEIAATYDTDWRGRHDNLQLQCLEKFKELIGLPPKMILDAGCGTGKDSIYLAARGYKVISLDLSRGMLEKTAEHLEAKGVRTRLVLGNMRFLCFAENSFDAIWTAAVLVHLPPACKKQAIQEFYRVLQPRGFLHIWVQNLLTSKHLIRVVQSYFGQLGYDEHNRFYVRPKSLKEFVVGWTLCDRIKLGYAYLDGRHWFYPTKSTLLRLLEDCGFSVLESNQIFARRLRILAQK